MDRMPKFDAEPVSLEIQPVEDMTRAEPEVIAPVVERETPFLPPKKERKVAEKKPTSDARLAHLERMRQRKVELKEARAGKKFKNATPETPTHPTPTKEIEEEKVEAPPAPKPTRKKAETTKKSGEVGEVDDFEKFLQHYEMLEKLKGEVSRQEQKRREVEEKQRQAELAKEKAIEDRIRKQILAEQHRSSVPRRWTPATKQPVPATQNHLSTPSQDFGIYSNRYF
jgi:hypothetical protein